MFMVLFYHVMRHDVDVARSEHASRDGIPRTFLPCFIAPYESYIIANDPSIRSSRGFPHNIATQPKNKRWWSRSCRSHNINENTVIKSKCHSSYKQVHNLTSIYPLKPFCFHPLAMITTGFTYNTILQFIQSCIHEPYLVL